MSATSESACGLRGLGIGYDCWLGGGSSLTRGFGGDVVLLADACFLGWFVGGTLVGLGGGLVGGLGLEDGQEPWRTA